MTFASIIAKLINDIINPMIPLVFTLAIIFFFWGLAMYILRSGDPAKRKEGTQMMTYGLLGLFVMFSVWGLLAIVSNTFSLDNTSLPIPQFRGSGGQIGSFLNNVGLGGLRNWGINQLQGGF